MAETATILIPDISGYTDFLSRTDVEHSAHIINHLLDRIVESMDPGFVVSEIEGDAVLLYKKGTPPSKKEIINQCIKTFTVFQNEIRGIKNIVICQCAACQDVTGLTLKFVIHFGTIAEIYVGRFMKASGIDMVIAHRLLKNNIPEHEYLLTTTNYLKNVDDSDDTEELIWMDAKEDYPSIGPIEFRFASLSQVKDAIPSIPKKETTGTGAFGTGTSIEIKEAIKEVFETIVNMEKRLQYVEGLKDIEGPPRLLMGPHYYYLFEEGKAEVEPRHVEAPKDEIIYEEYITSADLNLYAAHQIHLKSLGPKRCHLTWAIAPQPGHEFSSDMKNKLEKQLINSVHRLKEFCERNSSTPDAEMGW